MNLALLRTPIRERAPSCGVHGATLCVGASRLKHGLAIPRLSAQERSRLSIGPQGHRVNSALRFPPEPTTENTGRLARVHAQTPRAVLFWLYVLAIAKDD